MSKKIVWVPVTLLVVIVAIVVVINLLPLKTNKVSPTLESSKKCLPGETLTRVANFKGQRVETTDLKDEQNYEYQWLCLTNAGASPSAAPSFSDLNCGCSDSYKPVCGSDYKIYQNLCTSKCNKVNVAYDGECKIFTVKTLPAKCQPCQVECQAGDVFYADENGCPVCECREGAGEW